MEYTSLPGHPTKSLDKKIHWPKTVLGPNSKPCICKFRAPRGCVSQDLTAVGKNPGTLENPGIWASLKVSRSQNKIVEP